MHTPISGAALPGQYANVAIVTGVDPIGQSRIDDDPRRYFGVQSAISIEKATNGFDADNLTGSLVAPGSTVTWTYEVTNPGNVPLASVVPRDDDGTPGKFGRRFLPGLRRGLVQIDESSVCGSQQRDVLHLDDVIHLEYANS